MIEQLLLIAVIQGITEFLPVSSSGHLNLLHGLTDLPDQGLAIDVAVHLGTLIAVVIYNRHDIRGMAAAVLTFGRRQRAWHGVGVAAVIGTVPVVLAGFWLNGRADLVGLLRSVEIVAWATLVFGVLLGIADRIGGRRRFQTIHIGDGFVIGLAQVLALIPGTSRAGITMTAARAVGLGRRAAARFSMVLAIPVILGAGILKGLDLLGSGDADWPGMAIAAVVAMVVALLAIRAMMALIERVGFMPFVIYRIVLGAGLLLMVYF